MSCIVREAYIYIQRDFLYIHLISRHDIAEILLMLALNTNQPIDQSLNILSKSQNSRDLKIC